MKTHTSKIDNWIYVVLGLSVVLPVFIGWVSAGITLWPLYLISGGMGAFFLWLYLATKYVIAGGVLTIHGGLFKVTIPVASITSVTDTRNPLASPAFSLDRLEIKYSEEKIILISPKDKAAFLTDLGWSTG